MRRRTTRRASSAVLAPLWAVGPNTGLHANALAIRARYGYGFHGSLNVAAASAGGCSRLLSDDLLAGQTIDDVTVDPFAGANNPLQST